ncbi:MAG TPA: hypothetical protein VJC18_05760 [bacterium]|nr:hypothetical protein [bacterium]
MLQKPVSIVSPPSYSTSGPLDFVDCLPKTWGMIHSVQQALSPRTQEGARYPHPHLSLTNRWRVGRLLTTTSQKTRLHIARRLTDEGLSTAVIHSLLGALEGTPPLTTGQDGHPHYDLDQTVACLSAFGETARDSLMQMLRPSVDATALQKMASSYALLITAAQHVRDFELPRESGSAVWAILSGLTLIKLAHDAIDPQLLWRSAQNYVTTGINYLPNTSTTEAGLRLYIDFAVKELVRIGCQDQLTLTSLFQSERVTAFQRVLLLMTLTRIEKNQETIDFVTSCYIDSDSPDANSDESRLINQIVFNYLASDTSAFSHSPLLAKFLKDKQNNLDGIPFRYLTAISLLPEDTTQQITSTCASIISSELRYRARKYSIDELLADTAFIKATERGGSAITEIIEKLQQSMFLPSPTHCTNLAIWYLKSHSDNQVCINTVTEYLARAISRNSPEDEIAKILKPLAFQAPDAFAKVFKWAKKHHPKHAIATIIKNLRAEQRRQMASITANVFTHMPVH